MGRSRCASPHLPRCRAGRCNWCSWRRHPPDRSVPREPSAEAWDAGFRGCLGAVVFQRLSGSARKGPWRDPTGVFRSGRVSRPATRPASSPQSSGLQRRRPDFRQGVPASALAERRGHVLVGNGRGDPAPVRTIPCQLVADPPAGPALSAAHAGRIGGSRHAAWARTRRMAAGAPVFANRRYGRCQNQVSSCLLCAAWNSVAPGMAAKAAAVSWSVPPWNFTEHSMRGTLPAAIQRRASASSRGG